MPNETNGNGSKSKFTRQNILFVMGIVIALASWINADLLGNTFHVEFLLLAAAFCGVSITQWGDKK